MSYSKEDQLGRICGSMKVLALSDAKVGSAGVVERVDLPDEVSHYLAHLGFLPGTSVEILRRAPAGDPRVYRIDGVEVGLRNETAQHIFLRVISDTADNIPPATIEAA
jgi:ferrous iron transport protein A